MPFAPSLTENDVFVGLRAYLAAVVPAGCEVVQGQNNRVAEPASRNFIVMTPANRTRLATNQTTWSREDDNPETVTLAHNTQFDMQLDIHGPGGSDIAAIVAATFPDDYGRDALATASLAPLFASEGHQVPFINGEKQYENRWVMTLSMQITPSVLIPMQFAASLTPVINPALGG